MLFCHQINYIFMINALLSQNFVVPIYPLFHKFGCMDGLSLSCIETVLESIAAMHCNGLSENLTNLYLCIIAHDDVKPERTNETNSN